MSNIYIIVLVIKRLNGFSFSIKLRKPCTCVAFQAMFEGCRTENLLDSQARDAQNAVRKHWRSSTKEFAIWKDVQVIGKLKHQRTLFKYSLLIYCIKLTEWQFVVMK